MTLTDIAVALEVACLSNSRLSRMAAWASPAIGVTSTLIGRATFEPFRVKTRPHSLVDVDVKAKSHLDMVIRTHDYAAGSTTGWHTHPGPVFISVLPGQVTFYEADDPTLYAASRLGRSGRRRHGRGHLGRNETGEPAKDVTVILAPVNLPFRRELPAPNPKLRFLALQTAS